MATKLERTVLLPESVYNRIVRIAKEEHSNIPWVTRQLLAKAMADLKGKPEWFYEIEEQIAGLRNETIVVERAKAKRVERTEMHLEGAEEQLLVEIKKQIEELRREIGEVRAETKAKLKEQKPKEHVGNRFVTRQLLVNALAEERTGPDRPDRFDEIQRDLEWLRSEVQASQRQREKQELTGEQLYRELKKQIAELKAAVAVASGNTKVDISYETAYELMLWPELDEESVEEPLQEMLWTAIDAEPVKEEEPEPELVEEVASIQPAAKSKVLRPFFGRLTSMFNSFLG
ncbi:hypothetical protein KBI23_13730 [bacterium]|nr:hypothetical protein [bacterium]MBP9811196.1 hypothetical protein [bacterium]